MSRELQRKGPVGLGRSPESETRDRRNSDTSSSYLQIASAVPTLDLRTIPVAPSTDIGIIRRMEAIQNAYNSLLASLRNGQVINR